MMASRNEPKCDAWAADGMALTVCDRPGAVLTSQWGRVLWKQWCAMEARRVNRQNALRGAAGAGRFRVARDTSGEWMWITRAPAARASG